MAARSKGAGAAAVGAGAGAAGGSGTGGAAVAADTGAAVVAGGTGAPGGAVPVAGAACVTAAGAGAGGSPAADAAAAGAAVPGADGGTADAGSGAGAAPFRLLDTAHIIEVFERFKRQNPNPVTELRAPNPYCLLVCVVLSAQATDKSVNAATEPLFKVVTTPEQMLALGRERLVPYIQSIGLYNAKADHIMGLSRKLVEEFHSQVPGTREELMSLPGVGRKTANVILNVVFGQPTMPVDTHLLRICPKIGLAAGTTPREVEEGLLARIPPEYLDHAHHWLILHGRYTCTARKPKCSACLLADVCLHNG